MKHIYKEYIDHLDGLRNPVKHSNYFFCIAIFAVNLICTLILPQQSRHTYATYPS